MNNKENQNLKTPTKKTSDKEKENEKKENGKEIKEEVAKQKGIIQFQKEENDDMISKKDEQMDKNIELELLRKKHTDINDDTPSVNNKKDSNIYSEKGKYYGYIKPISQIDDTDKAKNYKIEENKNLKKEKGEEKLKEQYYNELKEIKKFEEEINRKEDLIKIKIEKEKYLKNYLPYAKERLREKIESFDINKIKEEENKLIEQEKILSQKEEKLKRKIEFYIPPNSPPLLIGLKNIGSTCYMNATLQCFSNTKKLTEYFLYDYEEDKNKILSNEYYHLLKELWKKENNNKSCNPTSFKKILSKMNNIFSGKEANDSRDLINFLLEKFHKELNEVKNNNSSIISNDISQIDQVNENTMLNLFLKNFGENYNSLISNLFYGISKTKSQCSSCEFVKFNFQIYSFLEFQLQQVNQYFFNNSKRPLFTHDNKNPDIDLYECFEYYSRTDNNEMYCNVCNKKCNLSFSNSLYSGPNYLIIILNRGKGASYECRVKFPKQLNLFNFITTKDLFPYYELYAVICHLGPSSIDGHFVAYCKNRIDNKWYLYNDDKVSICNNTQQYNDGMPYILFYKLIKMNS